MYKVHDKIKYRSYIRGESEGEIVSIFKIIDDIYNNVGEIVYLVVYDENCSEEFVFEENIIND